jgi:hypothetical protein
VYRRVQTHRTAMRTGGHPHLTSLLNTEERASYVHVDVDCVCVVVGWVCWLLAWCVNRAVRIRVGKLLALWVHQRLGENTEEPHQEKRRKKSATPTQSTPLSGRFPLVDERLSSGAVAKKSNNTRCGKAESLTRQGENSQRRKAGLRVAHASHPWSKNSISNHAHCALLLLPFGATT